MPGALEEAVKVRAPGEVVAVLLFDVDGLRDVNESLGHAAGDKVLRRGRPPAAHARAGRGAGRPGRRRRVRGDAAHWPTPTRRSRWPTSCAAALRDPMQFDTLTLDVDTAVGVAVHPDHGTDAGDAAAARRPGHPRGEAVRRRRPAVQPGLESRSVRRLGLAADLRRALDNGELEVYFQPKVALRRPPAGRRRVPGPLGAPGARRGPAGGLRRGRRAHRPARPAHRGGAAARACAGAREWADAGRAADGRGQPLAAHADRPDFPAPGRRTCCTSTACAPTG